MERSGFKDVNQGCETMPWTCRIVSNHREAKQPGDMWKPETKGRIAWLVRLPNGGVFDIFGKSSDGTGWQVTGEAPNFTLSPSINALDIRHQDGTLWRKGWHGWLQSGVLSDDCEGRTYERLDGK
jgi:hypothetical protein